jgi:hypothetical protein
METGKAYKPSTFLREPVLHILEARQVIGSGETIESLDELKQWPLSSSTLRIIEHGRDDEWQGKVSDDTDSGWQWRGVKGLVERGVPDAIVKGLITDPRWGISRSTFKERNRTADDYADRQIIRAHGALVEERKSRFPDDGIEEMYEKEGEANLSQDNKVAAASSEPKPKKNKKPNWPDEDVPYFPLTGDTSKIPPRDVMLPGGYIRGFVGATVGFGGQGKSQHTMAEIVALVTGLPILGIAPKRKYRWLLWNGDDPLVELRRRIGAICKYYKIEQPEGLFVISGSDYPLKIAATDPKSREAFETEQVNKIITYIKRNRIDGWTIDPFGASHKVSENSNDGMETVMQIMNRVVRATNIAGHVVYHPPKSGGGDGSVLSIRGGSAILNKLRASRSLFLMTAEQAKKYGIEEGRHIYFYRITTGDKRNMEMPKPGASAQWYEFMDVFLGNEMILKVDAASGVKTKEDCVGVPTVRELIAVADIPPAPINLDPPELDLIMKAIGDKEWNYGSTRKDSWIGAPVAKGLRMPLDTPAARKVVQATVEHLHKLGHITIIERQHGNGAMRKYYIASPTS